MSVAFGDSRQISVTGRRLRLLNDTDQRLRELGQSRRGVYLYHSMPLGRNVVLKRMAPTNIGGVRFMHGSLA